MQNHTAAIKRHKAALYNGTNSGEVCKIQVRYRSDVRTPRYPSHIKRGKIVLCVTESLWRVTLVLSGKGMRRRTISDIYTVSLGSVCLLDFEPCEYITFSKQELKFRCEMFIPSGPAILGLDPTAALGSRGKDVCRKIFTAPLLGLAEDGNSQRTALLCTRNSKVAVCTDR